MAALPTKLGIVAGGGILPAKLSQFCKNNNLETYVIGIDGHADTAIVNDMVRIGAAGSMIAAFKERGYKDLVIIGSVKRPALTEMIPDMRTLAFFAKLGARALGDDGLLKAVRAELESDGFIIHGIQDVMPDLIMQAGILTKAAPIETQYETIHLGLMESRNIGKKDIGQSVVVLGDDVLGIEDDAGTNALIKRAAAKGAILVKSSKPQQDRKLDMPTIGSDTLKLCASLGYAGIAAEAGGVLIADQEEMIAAADAAGLFVVGV
jgi:UDP-2,3-diacylglucosamine hydrolase